MLSSKALEVAGAEILDLQDPKSESYDKPDDPRLALLAGFVSLVTGDPDHQEIYCWMDEQFPMGDGEEEKGEDT